MLACLSDELLDRSADVYGVVGVWHLAAALLIGYEPRQPPTIKPVLCCCGTTEFGDGEQFVRVCPNFRPCIAGEHEHRYSVLVGGCDLLDTALCAVHAGGVEAARPLTDADRAELRERRQRRSEALNGSRHRPMQPLRRGRPG